jgi:membrane protease YdiL (CAAX protease family)
VRFLIDPGVVRVDSAAIGFLVIICVVLPAIAVWQHARHGRGVSLPDRRSIYLSAMITHAAFVLLAWALARHLGLELLGTRDMDVADVGIGVAALAIGLLPLWRPFRLVSPVGEERAKLIAPRTAGDHALFLALCVSAGVSEEVTYRGMLFTLLAALVRSWWIAAVLGAAIFGIVHLFQGWRSAGLAALVGLLAQIVVGLTGTLLVAIAVHTLHDAIAGTIISLRSRRESAGAAGATA